MAKTTISVPDALLEDIDRRASETGTTRSGFVQEAAANYIAQLDAEQARAERAERIGTAIDKMRETATHMPKGADGTAIIRRFRDMPEPWATPASEEDR